MDLTDKKTIKDLLRGFDLWAKRGFGQNFLIEKNVIDSMTEEVSKEDTVVEIGPGLGVLTKELCKKAKKVIAIEKDPKMVEVLKATCDEYNNLEVMNKDILKVDLGKHVKDRKYKVVANLPFYISSPIFRFFLESKTKPTKMTFIVQKEIAEKVTADDGDLNILAISVQIYAKAKVIQEVKSGSFWPAPKVDAAILEIAPLKNSLFEIDTKKFFRIVKAGFRERRKKLVNSLSGGLSIEKRKVEDILKELNIREDIRAERLTMANWRDIYLKLKV